MDHGQKIEEEESEVGEEQEGQGSDHGQENDEIEGKEGGAMAEIIGERVYGAGDETVRSVAIRGR